MKVMQIKLQKQNGIILISLVFILSLLIISYLINNLKNTSSKANQQQRTNKELSQAKTALLSWAVSNTVSYKDNQDNSINLGQLPYPDRNSGGGYDGFSDCPLPATTFKDPNSYSLLIGQLPVYGQSLPCIGKLVGLGLGSNEYVQNRFWYAVSRNVVHQYEFKSSNPSSNPIINPSIIHAPTYPWLKVLDKYGNIISDRVAAVIIAPGNALGNQTRSNTATITNYLDSFILNQTLYSNSDYDSADEDFFIGESIEQFDENNDRITKPYLFNDQLVFITIDELIEAISKRVAAEGKWLINAYKEKSGVFPYAVDLDTTSINNDEYFSGVINKGFLPLDITDNCQCSSNQTCSCQFGAIESISFYRESGSWNESEDTGSCKSDTPSSNKQCTCVGPGSCSRSFSTSSTNFNCDDSGKCSYFVCDANKNCTKDLTNNFRFTFSLPDHASFYNASNNCQIIGSNVQCNGVGNFNIGLNQAPWFKHNKWQQFMYYAFSPTNDLQVGDMHNIGAIIISSGNPITNEIGVNQTRPSNLISDYLDSLENTDSNNIFEARNKNISDTYNDRIFIISP